jgi:hypothetical protein
MSTAFPPQGNEQTREIPKVSSGGQTTPDHREVVSRQKEEFGGMKIGAGFFGWLAATGMFVLLTAIVAAVAAALGMSQGVTSSDATQDNLQTAGLAFGIALLVIIFIAYFSGGYVAGRMARFNGLKQGIAVFLWAVIITVVLGLLGWLAGSQYDAMGQINRLNLGVNTNQFSWAGVLAIVVVAAVALVGAILGGLAGMRFHRRVDKIGLN